MIEKRASGPYPPADQLDEIERLYKKTDAIATSKRFTISPKRKLNAREETLISDAHFLMSRRADFDFAPSRLMAAYSEIAAHLLQAEHSRDPKN